jgi:hypothetical protein
LGDAPLLIHAVAPLTEDCHRTGLTQHVIFDPCWS